MGQYFTIHPDNPQQRLIRETVRIIRAGGVVIYPTDAAYAIGCQLADARAVARIRALRSLTTSHYFTLMCRDLSDIGVYATVDNRAFRLLKANTPGPYTFILPATREVPRRLLQPGRNTIGMRIPNHRIVQAILAELGEPLMSVSLVPVNENLKFVDAEEIYDVFGKQVDLIIGGEGIGVTPTTVVSLLDGEVTVLREGKGDVDKF